LSRLHTSFVLGYHGCSKATGEEILAGRRDLTASENDYDWLGPGVYFWEADPVRAREWATRKFQATPSIEPFVLGAVIDLGNCLDLMAREDLEIVRGAYISLKLTRDMNPDQEPLPVNAPANKNDGDVLLRRLDCATIRHLHEVLEEIDEHPFDTVRGLFTEGGPLYPGSGFSAKAHVQITVRSLGNIKAYFRVAPDQLSYPPLA